jgi:hypothetical protein
MKKSCQLIVIILTLFSFTNNSCKKQTPKEAPNMEDAIITGSDVRACICCGGLMITFNGDSKSYSGDFRLISNRAVDIGITPSDTFPIYVKVAWKEDTSNVCHHIFITKIARR